MDLERFRLRRFLESLDSSEVRRIDTPVALADVAGILEGSAKAVWFTDVGPEGASLAGNVAGSRSRLAQAFGTSRERLLAEALGRLKNKPEVVDVSDAPCQQVVEKDPDLTAHRTSPRRPISRSTATPAGSTWACAGSCCAGERRRASISWRRPICARSILRRQSAVSRCRLRSWSARTRLIM